MQDNIIELTSEDGKKVKCQILFTYHSEEFNKDYVYVVLEETQEVSAYSYTETTESNGRLEEVTNEEEWKELEAVFNDYVEKVYNNPEAQNGCGGCSGSCSSCSGECDCDGDCDCEK